MWNAGFKRLASLIASIRQKWVCHLTITAFKSTVLVKWCLVAFSGWKRCLYIGICRKIVLIKALFVWCEHFLRWNLMTTRQALWVRLFTTTTCIPVHFVGIFLAQIAIQRIFFKLFELDQVISLSGLILPLFRRDVTLIWANVNLELEFLLLMFPSLRRWKPFLLDWGMTWSMYYIWLREKWPIVLIEWVKALCVRHLHLLEIFCGGVVVVRVAVLQASNVHNFAIFIKFRIYEISWRTPLQFIGFQWRTRLICRLLIDWTLIESMMAYGTVRLGASVDYVGVFVTVSHTRRNRVWACWYVRWLALSSLCKAFEATLKNVLRLILNLKDFIAFLLTQTMSWIKLVAISLTVDSLAKRIMLIILCKV